MTIPSLRSLLYKKKARRFVLVLICSLVSLIALSSIDQNNYMAMNQDDPRLINMVRSKVVYPPDPLPYNLKYDMLDYSTDGFKKVLDLLFNGKRDGVFVEAGAFDGEKGSNTLHLERYMGWSGLLVEPIPDHVEQLLGKHRKSWIAPVGLSTQTHPQSVSFLIAEQLSRMKDSPVMKKNMRTVKCPDIGFSYIFFLNDTDVDTAAAKSVCKPVHNYININCYPLYTLLTAAGISSVDLFTLDVEGNELDVLKTIPFHKIYIEVILVETDKLTPEAMGELVTFMNSSGFTVKSKLGEYELFNFLYRERLFVNNKSVHANL